jgi:hypothetical protein
MRGAPQFRPKRRQASSGKGNTADMTAKTILAAAAFALALGSAVPASEALAQGRPAAQAKKELPKLKQIFPYYDAYLRIPAAERTLFQPAYFVTRAGKPFGEAKLAVVDGATRTPIAVAADGRMRPPPLEMFRSKTALVDLDTGPGKFGVEMSIIPTAAPAQEMDAANLAASIDQTNRGIRRVAGILGMAAPKMAQVKFLGAGSGEVVLADGRRAPLPLVEGGPAFRPAAFPNASRIVLARTPSRALIGPIPKSR